MRPCKCYFCKKGDAHPDRHATFAFLSPENGVRVEGCQTCGHKRKAD